MAKRITTQGIFNHVYKTLVKQGRPSSRLDGSCFYRATGPQDDVREAPVAREGELCCAAGALLSDAEIDANGRLMGAYWCDRHSEAFPRFAAHQRFIRELQKIHDRWETFASWKNEMTSFAALHGLTVPNVD